MHVEEPSLVPNFNSAPTPATYTAPTPTPVPAGKPVKEKKKGKGGIVALIIILIIVLLGAAGFCYYWFTRPIYKINKAIETEDVATVCALFPELKDENEIKTLQDKMYNYAVSLEEQYIDEKIEYDELDDVFSQLSKKVLHKDEDFEALCEDVDALYASRCAYEDAEKAYKNEDYETAYDLYLQVIKADDNYAKAQDRAEECLELMVPDICGTWLCDFDCGDAVTQELGMEDYGSVSLPMSLGISFYDDGTGTLFIDMDSVSGGMSDFTDSITELMYSALEDELGYSRTEIDEAFEEIYGMSLEDYVLLYVDPDSVLDELAAIDVEFTYTAEDGYIYLDADDGYSEMFYYMDGENMVVTDMGEENEMLSSFGLDMPVTFYRAFE